MGQKIRQTLTNAIGVWIAHPASFLIWAAYVDAWILIQPDTLDWHGAAALFTWLMTLFIQRAEHRDTQAVHAKLDEVLKALGDAPPTCVRSTTRSPRRRGERKRDRAN